jgi:hypothetical protein
VIVSTVPSSIAEPVGQRLGELKKGGTAHRGLPEAALWRIDASIAATLMALAFDTVPREPVSSKGGLTKLQRILAGLCGRGCPPPHSNRATLADAAAPFANRNDPLGARLTSSMAPDACKPRVG